MSEQERRLAAEEAAWAELIEAAVALMELEG